MLLVYNKTTGHIDYTIADQYDSSFVIPTDQQGVMVSYIEYGQSIQYMTINPNNADIELKIGALLHSNNSSIKVGESVDFTLVVDKLLDSVNIRIGQAIFTVTKKEFSVNFEYPGDYYVTIDNEEYFCLPLHIKVV